FSSTPTTPYLHSFPTRRSSDLTKRVNVIVLNEDFEFDTQPTDQNQAVMLVFAQLACKVGLLEAIALQQIHIRCHLYDGSHWAIRDRKSTRLNSSHLVISYAVFC